MIRYIIRRLLYFIPTILGVAFFTFLLFRLVGGNPAYQLAGKNATPEIIQEIEKELGFDKPLFLNFKKASQHWYYIFDSQFTFHFKQALTFHFGRSYKTKQKISTIFKDGIGPSLSLAIPSFFIGIFLSISIALFAAFYRGSWFDKIIVLLSVIGLSLPVLAIIIAGQYFFGYKLGLFPISGYNFGLGSIPYLALPSLIWIFSSLGGNVRFFRTVILDEVKQDYVTTAKAKGLDNKSILFKHVLKNALIPILTNLIVAIPFLFTGSLLLENFFGIPGLGNMGIMALGNSDWPVINALTYIGAILFVIANLLSDITYALVDPRIKLS